MQNFSNLLNVRNAGQSAAVPLRRTTSSSATFTIAPSC